MKRILTFFRDTGHLWILLILLVAGGGGFLWARAQMIPESYGERGPYRGDALHEVAAKPMVLQADKVCLECHTDVGEERAGTLHEAVRCIHCHGLANDHVAVARKAADGAELSVPAAAEWDGDFMTHIDLYITQDRATCVVCHESRVGMPEDFKKIIVAEHLEEMGAEEPASRQVCFECHGGHDTAP
jgi:hypothetical protein